MGSVHPDPDRELVLACQGGDEEAFEAAFEELYARYKDRVYSIAYRITGRAADAMDVAQECFTLLFRKIEGFRFDSLFSTWLFRLVVNCSIDHRRHARSRGVDRTGSLTQLEEFGAVAEAGGPLPEDAAATTELESAVHKGLQRLSPKLRAILVLRYLEGLSYEELAAALDVPIGTVKSRLTRAHMGIERILRSSLEAHDYPVDLDFDLEERDATAPDRGVVRRRPRPSGPATTALLFFLLGSLLGAAAGSGSNPFHPWLSAPDHEEAA